jgi:hypothetical protein
VTVDTTSVLISCVGGAGMLIALVVGYKFGVRATVQTMKRLAEQKLTAAEFRQYQELLFKVYE